MDAADAAPRVSAVQVEEFLAAYHGAAITDLELLGGGFWSAAYAYRAGGRDLVLRLGQNAAWFETDRAAMAYDSPDLPVPEILDIGEAFDGAYAISVRHYGRFLETVEPAEADNAGPTIVRLLSALKAVPASAEEPDWRGWLMAGFTDWPQAPQHGWRATLAADPELDSLFRRCETRAAELVESCPERRDLLHGDLLHANVLVNDDASRVNAVFSWKCATRGDFLYDTAWCTFWGAFHPGIEAADVYRRVMRAPTMGAGSADFDGAGERHHCYELQIGATHLGWNVWVGDDEALHKVAATLETVLARGPLAS